MKHYPETDMLLTKAPYLTMERGIFSKVEELFKKTFESETGSSAFLLRLALLYRVTGHPEESLKVLERLFISMPQTPGIESTHIYNEARNLYSEIKAEMESKTSTH